VIDSRQIERIGRNSIISVGGDGHDFAAAYEIGCVTESGGIRIFRRYLKQLSGQSGSSLSESRK
jgi:hypothetical protein